jgi:hypothetical protein
MCSMTVLNDERPAAFQRWYPKFGNGQKAQLRGVAPLEMDTLLSQK